MKPLSRALPIVALGWYCGCREAEPQKSPMKSSEFEIVSIEHMKSGHAVIDGSNDGLPDAIIDLRAKFKKDKELRRGIR